MGGLGGVIRIHPDDIPDWDPSKNITPQPAPNPFDAYAGLNPEAMTWGQIKSGAQKIASMPQIQASDPYSARAQLSNQYASGIADVAGGLGALAMPVLGPAGLAEAPLAALASGVGGTLAQQGTEWLGEKAGAPEGERRLMGLLAGGVGGAPGETVGEAIPGALKAAGELAPRVASGVADAARTAAELIDRLDYNTQMGPEAGAVKLGIDKPQIDALKTELAARDVKARSIETLDQRIPQEMRVVSPDPSRTVDGLDFHDLDLDQPGEGFLPLRKLGPDQAKSLLDMLWDSSVQESEMPGGSAAANAVKSTGARPPTAEFFDSAFSLPQRARYWYELSAEAFLHKYFDLPKELQSRLIDAVAGTSGGVKPLPNMLRALGILSEDTQGIPITTDLRDPASAQNALSRIDQSLNSLKYRSFSGTMKFLAGLSDERPLTTNDVQVASMFGIKGEDIGKNPVLYEVLSRFFTKLRDAQNEHLAPGAQPWETWQMQAPAWVQERLLKNPGSGYDDYSQVLPGIIQKLQDAGIPTPDGKITLETLMHPNMPNLMSGTRERFLGTPIATVEVASKLTPRGAEAADLYNQLRGLPPEVQQNEPWARDALASYVQNQRNFMRAFMSRKGADEAAGIPAQPSLASKYASAIVGRKMDVSRMETGAGTYESEVAPQGMELNPNMRIPMGGTAGARGYLQLNPTQIRAMLSMMGQDFKQEAVAASHFQDTAPEGTPQTYSAFIRRYDGQPDYPAIQAFSKELGHSVNIKQVPNGVQLDINMNYPDEGAPYGPTREAVWAAAKRNFGDDSNVEHIGVWGRDHGVHYVHQNDYKGNINDWKKEDNAARAAMAQPGRAGRTWDPAERTDYLNAARSEARGLFKDFDKNNGTWSDNVRDKLGQYRQQNPPVTAPQPSPPTTSPPTPKAPTWDTPIQPAMLQELPEGGRMRTEHPSTYKIVRAAEKEMERRGFDRAYLRRAYGDTLEEGRVGTSEEYGSYLQNYLRRNPAPAQPVAPVIAPPNMARGGLYYNLGGLHGKYDRMRRNMLEGLQSSR